ncbi:DivIVA domain-containing protein [Rothia nasisuis]|uniref:DivIVA domain-containing protein n=1 Tax=Rothia nasisuis TaxID=2109647 RepID=UPI001F311913|nr:DivIVA domain-containing protein [Rothia nasisuis]
MNYLLVGLTCVVLVAVMVGCAVLGSDRLVPGRRATDWVSQDGIDLMPSAEPPLILSARPDQEELKRVRFATSLLGYNRDEVDGALARAASELGRLRAELAEARGQATTSHQDAGAHRAGKGAAGLKGAEHGNG